VKVQVVQKSASGWRGRGSVARLSMAKASTAVETPLAGD
jgi:hypothetical protein